MDEGTKILATMDGILRTVTESSIRRNLKLNDEEGLSSLPDTELFENLTLMGYNISPNQQFTFQKGQFSHQWMFLIHTIMQCLSPKSTGFNEFGSNIATTLGEGSGTPTEPYHTPSPEAQPSTHTYISSPTLPTVTTIPTVTPSETTPLRQYTRRARIAQSLALPPDRANIAKTSTLHHESTSRVTSLAADEGTQALEITELKARVKFLEDRQGEGINLSRDDAPIKGKRLDEEEVATTRVSSDTEEIRLDEGEVAAKRVSDDTEEMATVLITMDAASVLSSRGVQVVPTASTTISTATPIFATATIVTPYTRRKGKEKIIETHTPKKKKRLQEQIDIQDEEIAKIHVEKELQQMIEDHHSKILQYQAQQRKTRTKKQKRDFYMVVIRNNLGWKVKDFKGMSFEEVKGKFKTVWEQIEGGSSRERVSDDTKEMAIVLITTDAASVLSSGGVQVVPTAAAVAPANVSISTGSGVVPTAST
nr:hypothetical protein [Tanacetum cinerariifolium]